MSERFHKLVNLMAALRAPDGCPWDRKQTHESLKPYLLEETYEVLEVLDRQDRAKLPEELGDVLLQVLFHCQIASETGSFTIEDVLEQLGDKLIRRHPHVFGNGAADPIPTNADQVVARWEEIKRTERQASGRPDSMLDGVPQTMPALLRAYQLQARASRVGFDWTNIEGVFDKVREEIAELQAEDSKERRTEEMGDLLFALVVLAEWMGINAEEALRRANDKFIRRFTAMEQAIVTEGGKLRGMSVDEMDTFWNRVKRDEQQSPA